MLVLTDWENFYVIVGGSAAALTGLMFVVITLTAELRSRASNGGVAAFSSPTVVHFVVALLISAFVSAPWTALVQVAIGFGVVGVSGLVYECIVLRRLLRIDAYQPVLEDWLWHTITPFLSYTAIIVGALLLQANATLALFIVGGVTVLLIFTGIHNAWDLVTYIALQFASRPHEKNNTLG